MTIEDTELSDEDFEAFLSEEQPIDLAYPSPDEMPPPGLDAHIRDQARTLAPVVPLKPSRWMRPMAAAAVLVLCMSVVLSINNTGDEIVSMDKESEIVLSEQEQRQTVSTPRAPAAILMSKDSIDGLSSPSSAVMTAPASNAATITDDEFANESESFASEQHAMINLDQSVSKKARSLAATRTDIVELRRAIAVDIESRLSRVELLVSAGDLDAASATLTIFRVDYPDYPELTLRDRLPEQLFMDGE